MERGLFRLGGLSSTTMLINLCGALRISAFSAIKGNFNAVAAKIRRGPQRAELFILPFFALIAANAEVDSGP